MKQLTIFLLLLTMSITACAQPASMWHWNQTLAAKENRVYISDWLYIPTYATPPVLTGVNNFSGFLFRNSANGFLYASTGANGYNIYPTQQWITAQNYISSYTETDPTVSAYVKSITESYFANGNTAFGWGNHNLSGYSTSSNTQIFTNKTWQGNPLADSYISSAAIWNAKQGALSGTGLVKSTGGTISYLTDNSANWTTAYSWGNHAGLYPSISGGYVNPSWITSLPWTKITGAPPINTGGETLQSVTARGATTTNNLTIGQAYMGSFNYPGDVPLFARFSHSNYAASTTQVGFTQYQDGDIYLQSPTNLAIVSTNGTQISGGLYVADYLTIAGTASASSAAFPLVTAPAVSHQLLMWDGSLSPFNQSIRRVNVDEAAVDGSNNPVTSNALFDAIAGIPAPGTIDATVINGSTNAVQGNAVYDAIAAIPNPTIDGTVINGSNNSVSGNAVYDELALKSNTSHTHAFADLTAKPTTLAGYGVTLDATVINGSTNAVQGNAVFDAIAAVTPSTATSGRYTPTATLVGNLDSALPLSAHYIRIGNEVTVTGRLSYDSSVTGTEMQINLTLPVASSFTTSLDLAGLLVANSQTYNGGNALVSTYVDAETTADKAEFFFSSSLNTGVISYTFTYEVK